MRKRQVKKRFGFEILEPRTLLTGNVTVQLAASGILNIWGDQSANDITIADVNNQLQISGDPSTNITLSSDSTTQAAFNVVDGQHVTSDSILASKLVINVNLRDGDDSLTVQDLGNNNADSEITNTAVDVLLSDRLGKGNNTVSVNNSTLSNLNISNGFSFGGFCGFRGGFANWSPWGGGDWADWHLPHFAGMFCGDQGGDDQDHSDNQNDCTGDDGDNFGSVLFGACGDSWSSNQCDQPQQQITPTTNVITVTDSTVTGGSNVNLQRPGSTQQIAATDSTFEGAVHVHTGSGADKVTTDGSTFQSTVEIGTGAGADTIELKGNSQFNGAVYVRTGSGSDTVTADTATFAAPVTLRLGLGDDSVQATDSTFQDTVVVYGGPGTDSVQNSGSTFSSAPTYHGVETHP